MRSIDTFGVAINKPITAKKMFHAKKAGLSHTLL
jgi:hypothetical protein